MSADDEARVLNPPDALAVNAHMARRGFWRRRRSPNALPDGVLAESNGAVLVRESGATFCRCPFACLATNEPCEFA